ncbi:MAG: hypothetical protein PHV25_03305 [Candidatus Pacebacteria bacterium]|nr:hypothetical protein [Candidatus Paceibacterota bacterium]
MEKEQQVNNNVDLEFKKFFLEYPLISWNILTIVFLFIFWPISLISSFISLVFWVKRNQEIKEQKRIQRVVDAENYINKVKEGKSLPVIIPSISLEKNEEAFLEEETKLIETRAIRKHTGGMKGIGFRVAKGVYLGSGSRSGTSESHQEWRTIDSGSLIITNKRIVFNGSKENRNIPIKKIISISSTHDHIEVAVEARSKTIIFPVKNSYIWGAVINIVKRTDNPLNLDDMKLDIKFE